MRTIWLAVCRCFAFWFLRLHLYKFKSQLFRLTEPKGAAQTPIRTFANIRQLTNYTRRGTWWVPDDVFAGFDAAHSAGYLEQVFAGAIQRPKANLDCDDHAVFTVAAIKASRAAGQWTDKVGLCAAALSVMWLDGFRPRGHVVTIAIGSGYAGIYWADYNGWTGPFRTVSEVAANVRELYAPGSSAIGHCLQDADLTPLVTHWGE